MLSAEQIDRFSEPISALSVQRRRLWAVLVNTPVFVGSGFVAKYPQGGGNFWVPLQYILGLRQHSIDAFWLELLPATGNASEDQKRITTFLAHTERLGLEGRALVLYLPDGLDS